MAEPHRFEQEPVRTEWMQQLREWAERMIDFIPKRWAVGGAFVIVIVALLVIQDRVRADASPKANTIHAVRSNTVTRGAPVEPVTSQPRSHPVDMGDQEKTALEAQAAKLVVAGRLRDATVLYERLAAARADIEAFSMIAAILRQKLGASGCAALDPACTGTF